MPVHNITPVFDLQLPASDSQPDTINTSTTAGDSAYQQQLASTFRESEANSTDQPAENDVPAEQSSADEIPQESPAVAPSEATAPETDPQPSNAIPGELPSDAGSHESAAQPTSPAVLLFPASGVVENTDVESSDAPPIQPPLPPGLQSLIESLSPHAEREFQQSITTTVDAQQPTTPVDQTSGQPAFESAGENVGELPPNPESVSHAVVQSDLPEILVPQRPATANTDSPLAERTPNADAEPVSKSIGIQPETTTEALPRSAPNTNELGGQSLEVVNPVDAGQSSNTNSNEQQHTETEQPHLPEHQASDENESSSELRTTNGIPANPQNQQHSDSAPASVNPTSVTTQTSDSVPTENSAANTKSPTQASAALPDSSEQEAPRPSVHDARISPPSTTNVSTGETVVATKAENPTLTATQVEQLIERTNSAIQQAQQNGGRLKIRLHPPELGMLQIDITSANGSTAARLAVETSAAHQSLLDNLPQLKEALAQAGITVDNIDVQRLDSARESSGRQFDQSPDRDQDSQQTNQQAEDGGQQEGETSEQADADEELDIAV